MSVPSPSTVATFAHFLSCAFAVPDATNELFKNFLVSGDLNLINAPGFKYFKLLVE